jgi:hypothetical protein
VKAYLRLYLISLTAFAPAVVLVLAKIGGWSAGAWLSLPIGAASGSVWAGGSDVRPSFG